MIPTNVVTSMPVRSSFRTPFASKRVHGSQILLEHALQRFFPNFPLIQDKVYWKISPLVRSKFFRLFGNTFTTDRMYCRHRWEKLLRQLQTLLSQKGRTDAVLLIAFLDSTQNFTHFEKKDQLYS